MVERREAGWVALPDGGRLSYAVDGERGAPPLLLCRPLGGSMALWGEFAERLAARHRVIAFDPRGVGGSSDVPPGHSTRAMGLDAAALLGALGVERAHVFGLSLGGMVASWLAFDTPQRVDRLVLASTLPSAAALSPRGLPRGWSMLRCLARPSPEAEVCLLRRVLSREFRAAHPDRVAAFERVVRASPTGRENLARLAVAAARHRAGPALTRVEQETLLLFGELDPLVRGASRRALAGALAHATVSIVAGSGHDLSLERPREVADEVAAFLGGATPAAGERSGPDAAP